MLTVDDFDFVLPPELIAQHPLGRRSDSRLLFLEDGCLEDRFFKDLPVFLQPGDLLIFNDAKVIKARFLGHKTSGGRVEVLLERIIDEMTALVQMRVSKSPQPGSRIELEGAFSATVESRADGFFYLKLSDGDWWSLAERFGRLPLPPYITHEPVPEDEERYQTVFARMPGAVAAPTAGLHFDEELLLRLAEKGIRSARLTLYVGAGTFQPVRVKNLADHHMHYERYEISDETIAEIEKTRRSGCKVVAVGTTTLRALEAAASGSENGLPRAGAGETNLFITPGFTFRIVDRLLTNFHLPRSTLLMLVAAFAGTNEIKRAYMHAVEARYRFFSYGDAMLLDRAAPNLHLKNNV